MKQKLLLTILSVLLVFVIFSSVAGAAPSADTVIYVSVDGNDSGTGSINNPLRTLEGARNAVRSNPNFRKKPIKVIFREGTYSFEKGVTFDSKDSTVKTAPITYAAAEGEKVVFSGSKQVDTKSFSLVTDEAVLNLLPESARGKVYQTQLSKEVYGEFNELDTFHYYGDSFDDKGGYTTVLVNGKEQMESQWPNGKHAYADMGTILYSGGARYTNPSNTSVDYGTEFKYVDSAPDRWANAKYARFSGCPSFIWSHEEAAIHKVDPVSNTIKLEHPFYYGASGSSHRIWKAFNLIEEVDVPTEWYLDIETNILYYYPPEDFFDNDNIMEIVTLEEPVIKTISCKNLKFEGITFQNSRSDFLAMTDGSKVTVDGCSFINGKRRGLKAMQSIANIYNSKFMHLASNAIIVYGTVLNYDSGELADLGTTEIIGNYFYDVAEKGRNMPHAIYTISAKNFLITNNTFHNLAGGGIIGGFADSKLMFNEFYNYGQQYADMGGIYQGQTKNRTQQEIAYNFFYDYLTRNEKLPKEHSVLIQGVYMDDAANYGYIHDNIFYKGNYASMMIGGGQYNKVENNIIVDMKQMAIANDNRTETWCTSYIPKYPAQSLYLANVKDYIVKYPYVSNVPHDTVPPYGNRFANNISNDKFVFNTRVEELGDIVNNRTFEDKSIYVDPDNMDFRLKSGTLASKMIPALSEDKFDMSSIGCEPSVTENVVRSFSLISPVNNEENFEFEQNLLLWETADMADKYHVIVAKDSELKDVVFEGDVTYNWHKLENLENNTRYYWKVTAHNTSFKRKSSWESETGIISFVTSDGKKTAVDQLTMKLDDITDNFISKINESDYEFSKISDLKMKIKKAKNIIKNKDSYTNDEFYAAINDVDEIYQQAVLSKNIYFIKLDDKYFKDSSYWAPVPSPEFTEKGFLMKKGYNGGSKTAINLSEIQKDSSILQFRIKVDWEEGAPASQLISLDVRRNKDDTPVWSDSGYTAIVKQGQIELQKYPSGSPVVNTIENNVIKDGQWHDIAIGAITYPEFVQFIFMVDGKLVFDYIDNERVAPDNGKFGIYFTDKVSFELAPSEMNLDAEDLIYSVEHTIASGNCTVNGNWVDTQYYGYADTGVKVNNGDGTVSWKYKPGKGEKEIKFWKTVADDGDKSAKITVMYDYTTASEGEEDIVVKNIDFTQGDSGWYTIDTHNALDGHVIITLEGSGAGKIFANAVQFSDKE